MDIENERLKSDSPLWEAPSPSSERPPAVLEFPAETQQKLSDVCTKRHSTQTTTYCIFVIALWYRKETH